MNTKTDELRYEYDKERRRLLIFKGKTHVGGFEGKAAENHYHELTADGVNVRLIDLGEAIKKAKVKQLRAIWVKLGVDEMRDVILEGYGVTSTRDLTEPQLDELIKKYSTWSHSIALSDAMSTNPERRRMMSNVLSVLNHLGIYATNNDWTAVNNYVMSRRFAKYNRLGEPKMLFQMTLAELTILHRQLRAVLSWKNEKQAALNSITQMN